MASRSVGLLARYSERVVATGVGHTPDSKSASQRTPTPASSARGAAGGGAREGRFRHSRMACLRPGGKSPRAAACVLRSGDTRARRPRRRAAAARPRPAFASGSPVHRAKAVPRSGPGPAGTPQPPRARPDPASDPGPARVTFSLPASARHLAMRRCSLEPPNPPGALGVSAPGTTRSRKLARGPRIPACSQRDRGTRNGFPHKRSSASSARPADAATAGGFRLAIYFHLGGLDLYPRRDFPTRTPEAPRGEPGATNVLDAAPGDVTIPAPDHARNQTRNQAPRLARPSTRPGAARGSLHAHLRR